MTTSDRFSLSRTGSIFKKYILENWKVLLMRFILMLGVLVITSILVEWASFDEYRWNLEDIRNFDVAKRISERLVGFYTFIIYIFGCFMASLSMESAKSKTGRIAMFMTPATQLEKYIVRWVIAVPLFILLYIGCCGIADLTRCAFTLIIHPEYAPMVHPINLYSAITYKEYFTGETVIAETVYIAVYLFILAQSFFMLGSSVWPRNSLLKTFAALAIISTVYSVMFAIGVQSMDGLHIPEESTLYGIGYIDETNWKATCGIVVGAIAIFNYTLAYYRFKEMEIIQRM